MQYHWLNKQDNENLIVFFCGWSFDYKPFERLACGNNDVLCVYDYTTFCSPLEGEPKSLISMGGGAETTFLKNNPALDFLTLANACEEKLPRPQGVGIGFDTSFGHQYERYSLITWSMGVYVAYLLMDMLPEFSTKIAVNGTPYPVHDEWGIPQKTFDLTLKFVDSGLQGKFQKNLFKRTEDYEKYLQNAVARSIENQKQELIELDKYIKTHECTYSEFYDHAIISDTDKIIPTRNQLNFWNDRADVTVLNSGHFPFFEFDSWEDILKCKQTLKK